MVTLFQFLFSKHLWLNLVTMLLLTVLLVWLSFTSLNIYTNHGESITVPDLREFNLKQVRKHLESKDLRYTIVDSTYVKGIPSNVVIDQNPKPGAKVKEDRRIYLTINSKTAPIVKVPNIMYASLRNAEIQLKSLGLEVGKREHIPDLAKNIVLGIRYKGKSVEPKTHVPKGSNIDLILGDGLGNTRIPIPNLAGLTYHEAKLALSALSLNVGVVLKDSKVWNEDNALVYEQRPYFDDESNRMIALGEPIDLFLKLPSELEDPNTDDLEEAISPKPKPKPEPDPVEVAAAAATVSSTPRVSASRPTPPPPPKSKPRPKPVVTSTPTPAPKPKPKPAPVPPPAPKPVVATPEPAPRKVEPIAPPPPKPAPKPVVVTPPPAPKPKPKPKTTITSIKSKPAASPKPVVAPPPPPAPKPKPKPTPPPPPKPKPRAKPIAPPKAVAPPSTPKTDTGKPKSSWSSTRIFKAKSTPATPKEGGE